jgi:hypothetical protein
MSITQTLITNLNVIDAFVVSIDNDNVKKNWYSLCERGWFKENSGLFRSKHEVQYEMFAYTTFIEQLPIELKIDYINFYERQLNKAWKQLYIDTLPVKHFETNTVDELGT